MIEVSGQRVAVKLDLTPGAEYGYFPVDAKTGIETYRGTYEVIGLGKHVYSYQELVVYRHPQAPLGELLIAPLYDFAVKFRKVETGAPTSGAAPTQQETQGKHFAFSQGE